MLLLNLKHLKTQKVKEDDISQMNPPKYEKCEDMADLTYLNDATVLHNLRVRYMDWLIYVFNNFFKMEINLLKNHFKTI